MPKCLICDVVLTEAEWNSGTCPTCASAVGGPPPLSPPSTESTGPEIPRRDCPGWGTVRTGLGLLIAGIVLLLVCAFVRHNAERPREAWESTAAFDASEIVTRFGLFAAVALVVIGMFICVAIPRKTGCRGWIWSSTACHVTAIALATLVIYMGIYNQSISVFEQIDQQEQLTHEFPEGDGSARYRTSRKPRDRGWGEPLIQFIDKMGTTLALAGNLLFVTFVLAMASFQQRRLLKRWLAAFLVVCSISNGLLAITLWGMGTVNPFNAVSFWGQWIADYAALVLVGAFLLCVWYIVMLIALRSTITKLLRDEPLKPQ